MERYRKTWVMVAILAGIVMLGAASPANAQLGTMRVRIQDTTAGAGPGVVITDTGPLAVPLNMDAAPTTLGVVLYSGTIGGFDFQVTTGTSKPLVGGTINYAQLDLSNVTINAAGAGQITIIIEDTGYTGGPDGLMILRSSVGGVLTAPVGSTIQLDSWVSPSNAAPALGVDTTVVSPLGVVPLIPPPADSVDAWSPSFTSGPGAFSGSSDASFVKAGAYSLFARAIITFTGGGSASFDDHQQTMPAPGGLVLALVALPGFGLAWLRRRFKKTA